MNLAIILATVLVVWISGTAWALLGFCCMYTPCSGKKEVKGEENE